VHRCRRIQVGRVINIMLLKADVAIFEAAVRSVSVKINADPHQLAV
jgi:hypothetical protein